MDTLLYIRLIGYTAGTLLQLFWMVVILGYRRQRNFERVFFFLCLALFFFYSGSLLALNTQIHYAVPPEAVQVFAATLLLTGLCLVPPMLVHLHLEYAGTRNLLQSSAQKRAVVAASYAPLVYFGVRLYPVIASGAQFDLLVPGRVLGLVYGVWLAGAMVVSAWWEGAFFGDAPTAPERTFHKQLSRFFLLISFLVLILHVFQGRVNTGTAAEISTALAIVTTIPFAVMFWMVLKFNFLNIGRQKNLVYALTVTFLAVLYLSLVRRVSAWLENSWPPEATAAILLFLLVIFIEPLQRVLRRRLQETAATGLHQAQRLSAELQEEARQGDLRKLIRFIELRVKQQFELEAAWLTMLEPSLGADFVAKDENSGYESYSVYMPGRLNAVLSVKPHGAMLSGDAQAALESLCQQLPSMIELCRVIEEKLRLERELAERERLALVGQMAASISHNLKNPLGSMKTILQVQLENAELPDSIRGETRMVLEEIGRLSTKLNQLLQFSRPAVRGANSLASCQIATVVEEVAGVLSHEAERRGLQLQARVSGASGKVAMSAEALNDILSNLVVNALEATPRGGCVSVSAALENGQCYMLVEDDGPGIPPALRDKILQPFFTTKSQGTGLGLAIVARRVAEFSAKVDWESPVKDAHGTRFRVTLPMEVKK